MDVKELYHLIVALAGSGSGGGGSSGINVVGYVDQNTVSFPSTRPDGTSLQLGDSVKVKAGATLPFTISGVRFDTLGDIAEWNGSAFQKSQATAKQTSELVVNAPNLESISGTSLYQQEVNKEIKLEFTKKESVVNKITSFDDLEEGDITSYPNADSVKKLANRKIDATRMVGNKTLESDISIADLINMFKDVTRTYTNLTIDCDDNTLTNILVSMFKSGEVLSSIPDSIPTEEYKLATLKAVRDAITRAVQGAVTVKGSKNTYAEIEALTDMEVGDEWYCVATTHFHLYTEDGWIDAGGAVDLSNYIQKTDIVDNLSTNDNQKPLSAAQGKVLKDLADTKQDKIDIADFATELGILNPTLEFRSRKLMTLLGMTIVNIEADLETPITDVIEGYNELAKLPPLPNGYVYPRNIRVDCSIPSGFHTCEVNRHSFYDSDGDNYVNPNIANDKHFIVHTVVKVENAFSDAGHTTPILIAEQLKNSGGDLIVQTDGAPYVGSNTVEYIIDRTDNPKIYTLKYSVGQGYTHIGSYYDENGIEHTGDFYELVEITPSVDKTYMYQCYLFNKMLDVVGRSFIVNAQGQLCEFKITPSEQNIVMRTKEASVSSYFEGFNGTIEIIPIEHDAQFSQIACSVEEHIVEDPVSGEDIIDYYSLKSHGSNLISGFSIQKAI